MADEGQGAPADFGGRVLPNPTGIKPTSSEDDARKSDTPVGAKFSVQNAPADQDKANGISPHPLHLYAAKRGAPVRKLGASPVDPKQH
jgi:hypothetical protein